MRLWPHHPVHLIVGLTVWSVWFVVLYGGLSIGCQLAPPHPDQGPWNWLNLLLGLSTLVIVGALAWLAIELWRAGGQLEGTGRYICLTSAALYGVSAFSTLAVALPVLFLPPCI